MAAVARATFNCYISWAAYNIGLLTFDHSTFDGSDVFGVSPLDATFTGTYDDVSGILSDYQVSRGRSNNLDTVLPGTCTISLRDPTGQFNPANTSGPLYGTLEDRLHPIKLTASYNGLTSGRFYGWVQDFHWEPQGRRGITTLDCVDLFFWLGRANPVIASMGPTTTGAAIGAILDSVGATDPGMRDLNTGDQIPDFSADGSETALQLIQDLLEAERGVFFVAGNGKATYRSRGARLVETSAYSFVDLMVNTEPGVDWMQVYDRVTVKRTQDGYTAVATDAATADKVGWNDLPEIDTPYLSSDAAADALAQWILLQSVSPKPPMRAFTIDSRDSGLLTQILSRELVDRITISAARSNTTGDYNIDQLQETLDATTGRVTAQWLLSKASPFTPAVFDSSTFDSGAQFML